MKSYLLVALCLLLLQAPLCAQSVDVPEIATWEALRRGNLVEEIGPVGADDDSYFAEAIAAPPDDSHKWYFTLVTMKGCAPCAKLKQDFETHQLLRAWANLADPAASPTHFQIRQIEDETQRDWLAGISEQLKRGGYPALVIQPPRNGRYGPNKNVAAILHGYDGSPQRYAERLRRSIDLYVSRVVQPKAGIGDEAVARPPPFVLPPAHDPPPSDWPPSEPDPTPPLDSAPTSTWGTAAGSAAAATVLTLLLTIGLPFGLRLLRQWRIDQGKQPALSETQFQQVLDLLQKTGGALSDATKKDPSSAP